MSRTNRQRRALRLAGCGLAVLAVRGTSAWLRIPDDDRANIRVHEARPTDDRRSRSAPTVSIPISSAGPSASPVVGWIGASAMAGLANVVVGGAHSQEALVVFGSPVGGSLEAVDLYWVGSDAGRGYGSGDGGVIEVTVVSVDGGGQPVGLPLARGKIDEPAQSGPSSSGKTVFRRVTFSARPPIDSRARYGLLLSNRSADPGENYSSVNGIWLNEAQVQPMPWQAHHESWELRTRSTREKSFRVAYGDVGHAEPLLAMNIGGVWVGRHGVIGGVQSPGTPGGLWYEAWQQSNSRRVDAIRAAVRQRDVMLPSGRIDQLAVSARVDSGSGDLVIRVVGSQGEVLRSTAHRDGPTRGFVTIVGSLPATPIVAGAYSVEVSTTGSLVAAVGGNGDATVAGYSDLAGLCASGFAEWTTDAGATWTAFDRYGNGEPDPATDLTMGIHFEGA